MRWLRKLGHDLSEGQNIELYLTIGIALVLSILGAFNIVDTGVVAAITLATLALLALGTLNNREKTNDVQDKVVRLTDLVEESVLGNIRASKFFLSERPRYDSDFQGAKTIYIVGTTLSRTVRDYLGTFEKRLKEGASIKFVIIDPKSDAAKQATLRSYGVKSDEFYHNRIKPTIDLLQILASLPDLKGTAEFRLLPYMPSFGLILIDPGEANGKMYVEIYQHKSVDLNPTFVLDVRRDEKWFSFFYHQFDVLWASSRSANEADGYNPPNEKGHLNSSITKT